MHFRNFTTGRENGQRAGRARERNTQLWAQRTQREPNTNLTTIFLPTARLKA